MAHQADHADTPIVESIVLDFINDPARPERLRLVARETGRTLYTFTEKGNRIWRRPIEVQKEVFGNESPLGRPEPCMVIMGSKLQMTSQREATSKRMRRKAFLYNSGKGKKSFDANGLTYSLEKQSKKTVLKLKATNGGADLPIATFGTESIFDSSLATIRILSTGISTTSYTGPVSLFHDGKATPLFDLALCAFALFNAGKLSKAWTAGTGKYDYL